MQNKKKCLAHVLKCCLYKKHSRPTGTAFIPLPNSFTCVLSAFHLVPSPIHRARVTPLGTEEGVPPLTRATAQINWGTPPPWKKQEENDESLLYHGSPPTGGRELGGLGECPHATAQVLKYKARGVKRTIPQKYSTNLSMEAKGEWARPLPSEGVG